MAKIIDFGAAATGGGKTKKKSQGGSSGLPLWGPYVGLSPLHRMACSLLAEIEQGALKVGSDGMLAPGVLQQLEAAWQGDELSAAKGAVLPGQREPLAHVPSLLFMLEDADIIRSSSRSIQGAGQLQGFIEYPWALWSMLYRHGRQEFCTQTKNPAPVWDSGLAMLRQFVSTGHTSVASIEAVLPLVSFRDSALATMAERGQWKTQLIDFALPLGLFRVDAKGQLSVTALIENLFT